MNFNQITGTDNGFCTLSIFKFPKEHLLWAMKMMYFGKSWLNNTNGLKFYKLLGTGKGFSPIQPDLFRYGLFAVWKDATAAQEFFDNSKWINSYNEHSMEKVTIILKSYQSRGSWSGINPFESFAEKPAPDAPVAILTRGSIKVSKVFAFWKHEPAISRTIYNAPGLIASAGLGEYPFFRQVTFSIWENEQAMMQFAHGNSVHGKAAQASFDHHYFSEWMFTRLKILAVEGNLSGFQGISKKVLSF